MTYTNMNFISKYESDSEQNFNNAHVTFTLTETLS